MHECVCRKSMPQVVEARPPLVVRTAQTDLPGQGVERSMNVSAIQSVSPAGDEQIGGHLTLSPMTSASDDVVAEHFTGRRMQRHQAGFAELGAADRQHPRLEIDILKLKITCFAETQARNAQKPEQTVVDPRPQFTAVITTSHLKRSSQ